MVGLIFILCLLFVLTGIGFLFAWLVSLASYPQGKESEGNAITPAHSHTPCPVHDQASVKKH